MEELKCEVIRDLLPLYQDNAISEETQEMVRSHLKNCPACREELRKMRTPISLPPDEDEEAVKRFLEHRAEKIRKKRNIKIACVVSVLAVIALFCLWYTLVPRSWQDISRAGQIRSLYGSYDDTVEVTFHNNDPGQGGIYTSSAYRLPDMDSGHPAAQVIINALEGRSYRADLGNLRPGLFLPDRIDVPGTVKLHFYLRTQNRGLMGITIYSNGLLAIGGLTSMTPQGCLSYKTDTGLFQEVFEIMQEYSTFEKTQDVIEPRQDYE